MTHADATHWQQINIRFTSGPAAAEHHAIAALGPALTAAEDNGLITAWFFIRKPHWRIRYLPASAGPAGKAARFLHDTITALHTAGHAQSWTQGIYEPETRAFGGPDGMTIAHRLFHADSRSILTYLADADGPGCPARRRELSLLLCTALMTAAGQDRFERGDVWAKVSDLRTARTTAGPAQWETFTTAVARVIAVDTRPGTTLRNRILQPIDPWLTSFEAAGRELRTLTDDGRIQRGLRAVLAHHVIFHWNRIGIPGPAQANLARAATQAAFD
jgi:thiopeptide-type bacteriocin biosynthesis protein